MGAHYTRQNTVHGNMKAEIQSKPMFGQMIRAMGENNKEKKDKGAQIGLGLREVASLKMLFWKRPLQENSIREKTKGK